MNKRKGWYNDKYEHKLASKGIKTSFARMRGHMHDRNETWKLREEFINQYGYYDKKQFADWVYKNTGLVPYERSLSEKADYLGNVHLVAGGVSNAQRNKIHNFRPKDSSGKTHPVKAKEIWGSKKRNIKDALWGEHLPLEKLGDYTESWAYLIEYAGHVPIKNLIDKKDLQYVISEDDKNPKHKLFFITDKRDGKEYLAFLYTGAYTWGGRSEMKSKVYEVLR